MNLFIMLVIIGFILLVIPVIFLIVAYVKSFNRRAVVFEEFGDNPNDAKIKVYNYRENVAPNVGRYIKFFLSSLKRAKLFDSHYKTRIEIGGKIYEGLILYAHGDNNVRPIKNYSSKLEIIDEDNRGFKLNWIYVSKRNSSDTNALYVKSLGIMLGFVVVIAVIFIIGYFLITRGMIRDFLLTPGVIS